MCLRNDYFAYLKLYKNAYQIYKLMFYLFGFGVEHGSRIVKC